MKLKYIFTSLVAAFALMTGCSTEEPVSKFKGMEISNDFIGLESAAESQSEIIVKGEEDWTISSSADWLTINPAAGTAGQKVSVTFTAKEAKSARNTNVYIKMGSKTKIVYVVQSAPPGVVIPLATCKDIIEGPDKSYKVKGKVTKITGTKYGNWYINDGTVPGDGVYIYGTLNKNGAPYDKTKPDMEILNCPANPAAWELAVGDEVTVEGPKTVYNGTIELVNVAITKIVKSLVSVDKAEVGIDAAANDIVLKVVAKAALKFSSDADWLTVKSMDTKDNDTTYVTLRASENVDKNPRKGTISFTASNSENSSTVKTLVKQAAPLIAGGSGTYADPYTPGGVAAYIDGLAGAESAEVFVKGKISKIVNAYDKKYGNAKFFISEDGTEAATQFEAYNVYYLNNAKWEESFTQNVKAGDDVLIYGKVTVYKGTYETVGNKAYLYSLNGFVSNIDAPCSPAQVNAYIDFLQKTVEEGKTATSKDEVYVKGKVSAIDAKDQFSAKYGNASFSISEDGTSSGAQFNAFRCLYFGKKKWVEGNLLIEAGKDVVVCGNVSKHNTTYQTTAKSYLVFYDGKTE